MSSRHRIVAMIGALVLAGGAGTALAGNSSSEKQHQQSRASRAAKLPHVHSSDCGHSSAGQGREPTLQALLDREFGPGVLGATQDSLDDGSDASWTAGSGSSMMLMFEYAGFSSVSVFGIYDSTSPDSRLALFHGFAAPASESTLGIVQLDNGTFRLSVTSAGVTESAVFGSSVFGFYLRTPDHVFHSDTALNTDSTDHMRAFDASGLLDRSGYRYGDGSYLLAWEDLLNGGDHDFNDLVIGMHYFSPAGVSAVPLPAAALLFGSGLLGLAGLGARRRGFGRKVA